MFDNFLLRRAIFRNSLGLSSHQGDGTGVEVISYCSSTTLSSGSCVVWWTGLAVGGRFTKSPFRIVVEIASRVPATFGYGRPVDESVIDGIDFGCHGITLSADSLVSVSLLIINWFLYFV
eukprot:sb/3476246/